MPPWLRNLLAVLIGFLVGSLVKWAIVSLGSWLFPLFDFIFSLENVSLTDSEKIKEYIRELKPVYLVAPWSVHAIGTAAGAFTAFLLATGDRMKPALIIGVLFLLMGSSKAWMATGPWFVILDLGFSYLPMACLGAFLAGARKTGKPAAVQAI